MSYIKNKFINNYISKQFRLYIQKCYLFLAFLFCNSCSSRNSSIIASITSYQPRIKSCWISLSSLFNQDFEGYKIVLVLSLEEFPSRKIPWTLKFLQLKGLEILWCKENYKSYKKLLPTRKKYPNSKIITFDDDLIYEKWRIRCLISENKIFPESIIGHRGREIKINSLGEIENYSNWEHVYKRLNTKYTFLTGGGGILYPPNKSFDKLIHNFSLANKICPNADDIFFWAIAYHLKINVICLGNEKFKNVFELRNSPKLWTLNRNKTSKINNDTQLDSVIKYYKIDL